jgi:hypothetical protein
MGKVSKSNTEIGDVHAPIEETEVPLGLKLLVAIMVLSVGGMATIILFRLKIF